MAGTYLVLHGHFYQPPRENPWLERCEQEESARPFHDWNERIHRECYQPNARARILDAKGRIVDIVNNYEWISFNFGPTLLSWLERTHPDTYQAVLDADRSSRSAHNGHGNAMAQVYNHMILPLANRRDQVTQVRWGIEDFRYRFGRDPESIWLPETAANAGTLEVLAAEGIRFIILAPHQAEAVRPIDSKEWRDVSNGTIDPRVPYRAFLGQDPGRFIDVFFYDGPIAKDLGFGDLAFEAKLFAGRLEGAVLKDHHSPQLIHIATDGETYGHHKAYGERALAYLLNVEAPKRGFRIVNYGEHLDQTPVRFAVKLKGGEGNEGTSWSCAHGTKRWKEHCGCRAGGPAEWTQDWRRPLRAALDWLRDELAPIYEREAGRYFRDVWEARNDYIAVVLNRSEESISRFLNRAAGRPLEKEETVAALKLLELQRHAMLMYTSCGWFFDELSGIETVQNLEYAARAVQLAFEVSGTELETPFLERLAQAKSNRPELKDGRGVYEALVRPRIMTLERVTAIHALCSMLDEPAPDREKTDFCSFRLYPYHQRKESFGSLTLYFGRLRVVSTVTFEEAEYLFLAVQIGWYDFRCSVMAFQNQDQMEQVEKELFDGLHSLSLTELLRKIDEMFGEYYYALKDLPLDERIKIISDLSQETIEKINAIYEQLYDENRMMNEMYRSIHQPIPRQIHYVAAHTLGRRLVSAVRDLGRHGFNLRKASPVLRMMEMAKAFGVELEREEAAQFLAGRLEERIAEFCAELKPELLTECLNIGRLAKRIQAVLDIRKAQDDFFFLLKQWLCDRQTVPASIRLMWDQVVQLAADLRMNPPGLLRAPNKGTP